MEGFLGGLNQTIALQGIIDVPIYGRIAAMRLIRLPVSPIFTLGTKRGVPAIDEVIAHVAVSRVPLHISYNI